MSEHIVGIDLGTTNSELAVSRNGKIEVLPIHGNPIMPVLRRPGPGGQTHRRPGGQEPARLRP